MESVGLVKKTVFKRANVLLITEKEAPQNPLGTFIIEPEKLTH